ncbi:MAG: type IV pilus assembly protein PilM [Clostridia bacterium]|nr:type IV pilus assembly protein PilM [Clostridia bacterium]
MGLFGNGRVVGLEFDEGAIRGVEITKKGTVLTVSAYSQVAVAKEAIREGLLFDQGAIVEALEELWVKGKFRSKEIVIGVSNQGVIIRFALFPKVTPNRLDNLVRLQAQEHLPVPMDTVFLDYDVIGTKSDGEREMLEVLLVAGRKEMLESFLQVLTAARLKPKEIEVLPLTLLRFLKKGDAEKVVAVIDIAQGLSNMVIADSMKPRMARMMPTGMDAAERLVAATREEGIGVMEDSFDNELLANNIQATIGFYQSHKEARPVEKILLSGIGSQVAGLAESLESRLHLPVKQINPVEYLELKLNSGPGMDFIKYGLAACLACRGWE